MPRALPAAALLALLALAGPAAAQVAAPPAASAAADSARGAAPEAPAVALTGNLRAPHTLTLADLQALPAVTAEVPVATAQGPRRISYTGTPLWPLVQAAAPVDAPGHGTSFQHVLMARGRDGYAVAVAFGEMDPHLEGKQVLVAYAMDGRPLPAPRLFVPGDAHGARAVHDLVQIEVR